jgi:spermidine synthase
MSRLYPAGRLHAAILLIGAVGISYEIALMRVLSIAQWHHFAYMIISIAMLGFAVSGTAIALLRSRIAGMERRCLAAGALALSASLTTCFALSQRVPFETFRLTSEPAQLRYLFLLYLILGVPFFLVSWCVALGFLIEPRRVGRLYFFNMLGSGLGAGAVVALLFWVRPGLVPLVLTAPAALGFSLAAGGLGRRWQLGLIIPAVLMLAAGLSEGGHQIRGSEYKGLAHALRLPDAHVVARSQSPLSELTAVASSAIRETPGQLSGYPMRELGELPEQVGLYFDGGSVSVVSRFDGALEPFAFLDYVTGALPYRLTDQPETLVVGAGGGIEVLSALYHGARHVTAVEVDPSVHAVMRQELRNYSGQLYERKDVTLVLAEGRRYLEGLPDGSLDLIQFALLDSFSAASAGVHALSESYLYTREAIQLYLRKLRPGGVLSITRWLKTPPRDAIKLFGTMVEAAERAGVAEPGLHLAFVRSWNTGTIVLSRAPLTEGQIRAVRDFATERGLDLSYLPGIRRADTNRFTVLDDPIYYEAATALLSNRREQFYRDYAFHVRPASDDRPHFFRFFRWRSAGRFIEGTRRGGFNFVEWGYVALIATVVQAAIMGFLLVLLPLILFARGSGHGLGAAAAYFAALGFAYMFLEIAFIQRFMLFLAYPVYAVAVVLSAFLVFSGLGSYAADRRLAATERERRKPLELVRVAVLLIAAVGGAYLAIIPVVFRAAASWPDPGRVALSLLLLSPLAFFMGIPFPAGLQLVSDRRGRMVPWAWGLNGAASVLGATLATLLAIHLGFGAVVVLAFACYAAAAIALGGIHGWTEET